MQNENKDGIYCDYCNKPVNGDFIYYSFDFRRCRYIGGSISYDDDLCLTADLCSSCMKLYENRIIEIYSAPKPGQIRCDITGNSIKSGVDFYKCFIAKVDVAISSGIYKCTECGKTLNVSNGPCCNGASAIREANVNVDDKFLDLIFDSQSYEEFKRHLDHVKTIGADGWNT